MQAISSRCADRLASETTGILNRALIGYRRMRQRGYFIQPASASETQRGHAGNIGRGRRIQPLKAAAPKRLSAKEKGRGAAAFL
jgi:hypothetical protein